MTTSMPVLSADRLRILEAQLSRMRAMGDPWSTFYLPVVIGWALVNGAYLAWYFIGGRNQRAIQTILADAYEPAPTDAA